MLSFFCERKYVGDFVLIKFKHFHVCSIYVTDFFHKFHILLLQKSLTLSWWRLLDCALMTVNGAHVAVVGGCQGKSADWLLCAKFQAVFFMNKSFFGDIYFVSLYFNYANYTVCASVKMLHICITREKEEIWLSPMTEALTPTEKSKKQRDNTKNATKNFDYTTIADRLRTVNWGNDSHPAGVVKPVYGIPTFPLTAKAV